MSGGLCVADPPWLARQGAEGGGAAFATGAPPLLGIKGDTERPDAVVSLTLLVARTAAGADTNLPRRRSTAGQSPTERLETLPAVAARPHPAVAGICPAARLTRPAG